MTLSRGEGKRRSCASSKVEFCTLGQGKQSTSHCLFVTDNDGKHWATIYRSDISDDMEDFGEPLKLVFRAKVDHEDFEGQCSLLVTMEFRDANQSFRGVVVQVQAFV